MHSMWLEQDKFKLRIKLTFHEVKSHEKIKVNFSKCFRQIKYVINSRSLSICFRLQAVLEPGFGPPIHNLHNNWGFSV